MMEGLIVADYYLCRMVALNLSYTLNHLGDLESGGKKKKPCFSSTQEIMI